MNNYYQKALLFAQQSDITSALNTLYPYLEKTDSKHVRKLYGLCLYRFGDYEKAYSYLNNFSEYKNDVNLARKRFKLYKQQIISLVEKNCFKQAIKIHDSLNNGSVLEKNIEGCLYALAKNPKVAERCFVQALLLDKGNKESVAFIELLNKMSFFDTIKNIFKSVFK